MNLILIIARWCSQKMFKDYAEEVRDRYANVDEKAVCRNITFQVTDDCCLKPRKKQWIYYLNYMMKIKKMP